jgi:tetratricopeptide (TPR) repeat protein
VEEVLRLYERMVAIAQECGDFNNYCGGLFTLGDVWRDHLPASDHPDHLIRAEEYYARALKVCEEFRLAPDLRAEILLELGRAVVWQGRIAEGIARLEECLAFCRQSGLERTMTSFRSRLDLVDACWDAGDRVSAAHHLRDAFALARDREAGIDVSISLLESMAARLSSLAHLIGAKVGEGLAEAERLAEEKAGDPAACKLRSTIYAAVGISCTQAGEWQRALDAYQMAIEEARACGDERAADRWLDNQAKVYLQLGQQTDAERTLKQTLPAHQRRDDLQGQANQLLDYGHIFLREKQPVRAANHAAQCFALFHRLGQPNGMLAAVLLLGEAFRAMGDLRKAEASLHYCCERAESVGARRIQFYVLDKLAEIEVERGDAEKADEAWAEATRLAAELGEFSEQEFRVKRGKLLQSLSRPDEAEAEYRRAISQFEAVRGEFRSAERRMQAQSRLQEAYALLLALLAETKGDRTEAFDLSERARSRTLAELLSRREVRQPASLPRELASREWRLLSELSRLEDPSQSGVAPARRHAALIRELEELWRTMAAIDEDCRAYADLRREPHTDFAELTGLLVI